MILVITAVIFLLSFVIVNKIDSNIQAFKNNNTSSSITPPVDSIPRVKTVDPTPSNASAEKSMNMSDISPGLVDDNGSNTQFVSKRTYELKRPISDKIGNEGLLPGTHIIIINDISQDGQVNYDQCTAAFSVPGVDGFPWAITAGHCGKVGQKVYSKPIDGNFNNIEFLGTIRAVPEVSYNTGMGDWGAIRLDPNATRPPAPNDIPMNLLIDNIKEGEVLCKNGSRTGADCGTQGKKGVKTVFENSNAKLDEVVLCALSGDSGSPIYNNRGIVGVLSSSTAPNDDMISGKCTTKSSAYYTPTADIVKQLKTFVPNAEFIDQ